MYTYSHINVQPKTVPIKQVDWKVGDAFESVASSNRYLVTKVEPLGYYVILLDSQETCWFGRGSIVTVRRLNVNITTSYAD